MHDETIPVGLCQCGCGGKTKVARQSVSARGHVKGQPQPFIVGHHGKRKHHPGWRVDDGSGCWIWTGDITRAGYGRVYISGHGRALAHRWMFEQLVGPIAPGLEIDHVKARGCTSTACVNPDHLEAVSGAENLRRQGAHRTHCKHGHPLSGPNLRMDKHGVRICVTCQRRRNKVQDARRRALRFGDGPARKLMPEQAAAIRDSDERGVVLAARYGVSDSLISQIRSGKIWR